MQWGGVLLLLLAALAFPFFAACSSDDGGGSSSSSSSTDSGSSAPTLDDCVQISYDNLTGKWTGTVMSYFNLSLKFDASKSFSIEVTSGTGENKKTIANVSGTYELTNENKVIKATVTSMTYEGGEEQQNLSNDGETETSYIIFYVTAFDSTSNSFTVYLTETDNTTFSLMKGQYITFTQSSVEEEEQSEE